MDVWQLLEEQRAGGQEGIEAAKQLNAARQLGSYAAKLDNSEIPHEQLNDTNLSTIQPFNQSTDKDLSPYHPIALSPFFKEVLCQ